MNTLSLFTGAGGGELASQHILHHRAIGYVEINEYCQRVIAQRIRDGLLDDAPIFTDITAFLDSGCAGFYRGVTDIITGGFPCQDISAAGKGAGITGERSGLWSIMAGVIRIVRPRFVFVENSPMLASRGLGTVLGDLAQMGYDARWCVLGAHHAGGNHKRDRIWILADADGARLQGADVREARYPPPQGLSAERGKGQMWPPPCQPNNGGSYGKRSLKKMLWPVPCANDSDGKLNPDWVEWLMGWPIGWSSLDPLDKLVWPDQTKDPADIGGTPRTTTAKTNRVSRLKAIGNGQVPACAAMAWEILGGSTR